MEHNSETPAVNGTKLTSIAAVKQAFSHLAEGYNDGAIKQASQARLTLIFRGKRPEAFDKLQAAAAVEIDHIYVAHGERQAVTLVEPEPPEPEFSEADARREAEAEAEMEHRAAQHRENRVSRRRPDR